MGDFCWFYRKKTTKMARKRVVGLLNLNFAWVDPAYSKLKLS
jgi:hypothetical protein